MALDTALLLPCPFCREVPDESPLSDVTRWALFGVEESSGTAALSLPSLTASASAMATVLASGSAGLQGLVAAGEGAATALGVGALSPSGLLATGAATATATGTASLSLVALAVAAEGLTYAAPPSATATTALVVASAATASVDAEYTTAAVSPQHATAEVAAQLATASVTAEAATAEVTVAYVGVVGDTLPVLTATLSAGGSVINLTGASVQCLLRIGSTRISKTATVTNASGGVVTVNFAATDLVAGRGECQFVITFGDGSIRTVPNSGENVVVAVAERL